jgi:hypothetical protein
LNILVALEGVLSSENKVPNRTSVLLYYSLVPNHRVAIFTSWSKKDAEHWLLSNGIIDYAELIDDSYDLLGEELPQRQITIARSRQPVEMVITADPLLSAWCFENGMPSLCLAHSDSTPIRNRPGLRNWGAIQEAITKRNVERSKEVSKDYRFE